MELQKPMEYKTLVQRFEYVVAHRLKDRSRMEKAMETQDRVRSMTKGETNLTEEIRKWRDKDAPSA